MRIPEYAWSIDPNRVRNMSQFSSAFGSSHLVCDAAVYGVGFEMNNLQKQNKWNPNAHSDPVVPIPPDFASEASMSSVGTMSGDAWDTSHVSSTQSVLLRSKTHWMRYDRIGTTGLIRTGRIPPS